MSRNGSGVYSLPEPVFVPNTPISSAAVNSDFSDIATALTASIAADGQTPITAALKLDNAGFTYASDPNTGIRRTAADTQAIFAGGVDALVVTAAGSDTPGRVSQKGAALVPAGAMLLWTTLASTPSGWLRCDGSAVSRTTYADLFTIVSTTFGAGDGSTTFNVPQTIGRAAVTVDQAGSVIAGMTTIGSVTGGQNNVLAPSNLPAYTPTGTVSGGTFSGTGNWSGVPVGYSGVSTSAGVGAQALTYGGGITLPTQLPVLGVTSPTAFTGAAQGGSSAAFSIVQPSIALLYLIKT